MGRLIAVIRRFWMESHMKYRFIWISYYHLYFVLNCSFVVFELVISRYVAYERIITV